MGRILVRLAIVIGERIVTAVGRYAVATARISGLLSLADPAGTAVKQS